MRWKGRGHQGELLGGGALKEGGLSLRAGVGRGGGLPRRETQREEASVLAGLGLCMFNEDAML